MALKTEALVKEAKAAEIRRYLHEHWDWTDDAISEAISPGEVITDPSQRHTRTARMVKEKRRWYATRRDDLKRAVEHAGERWEPIKVKEQPTWSAEDKAIDEVVRKLHDLSLPEAQKVLEGLDPDFVRDVFKRLIGGMDRESKARLSKVAKRMAQEYQPQDRDALYNFVARECGLKIPRKAVCVGHCAPFDFLADVYFAEGNTDKLAVGNRGSGKTQIMGALHAINARTKRKYTACTVGAVEAQAQRAYGFFKELVSQESWRRLVKGKILMQGTTFENGAKVEIVTGTISGVNSPHPVMAHFDEVELLRPHVYDEALNMAQSKDGYRSMNVLTSSWKKPKGFVSELIDENEKAQRAGIALPYQLYRWCVWETTSPCEHDCNACPFSNVVKGQWEDGSPRTFESACKRGSPEPGVGKLKFTDGFVSVEDAVGRFRKLPKRVFEAQQESKRPTLEGLVYDCFDEDLCTVEWWEPDPSLGTITCGVDFGTYQACCFWQHLDVEVKWGNRVLPEGANVVFDEVYIKDVGNVEFGRQIQEKIRAWRDKYPAFAVEAFYRDPAAKQAGADLARLSSYLPECEDLRTLTMGNVPVEERIALVYELISNGMVFADKMRCEGFMDEIGGYEYNENTGKPVKEDDHLMDAMGYRFWNIHARGRRRNKSSTWAPVGQQRPRAVVVSDGRRMWDPEALGTTPVSPDGAEPDGSAAPAVRIAPRSGTRAMWEP